MTATNNSCLVEFDIDGDPLGTYTNVGPTPAQPHHLGFTLTVVIHVPECESQKCWNLSVKRKHKTPVKVPSTSVMDVSGPA